MGERIAALLRTVEDAGPYRAGNDGKKQEKSVAKATDFSCWGLERKRGRKEFYGGKGAAHGFRNLSIIKITRDFEQPMSQMKTKFDQIMNKGSEGLL